MKNEDAEWVSVREREKVLAKQKKNIASHTHRVTSILHRHSSYFINFMCVFTSFSVFLILRVDMWMNVVYRWRLIRSKLRIPHGFSIYTCTQFLSFSLFLFVSKTISFSHAFLCFRFFFLFAFIFSRLSFIMWARVCQCVAYVIVLCVCVCLCSLRLLFSPFFPFSYSRFCQRNRKVLLLFVVDSILCIVSYRKSTEYIVCKREKMA